MGQKTNPISLRLNIDRHFDSCWYPGQFSQYGQYVQTDLNLREYLKSLFASLGLHTGRMNVQMFPKKLHIHYFFYPDPMRVSRHQRFHKIAQKSLDSEFKGLSFLRSVREKQKSLSMNPSLTFREALALERQKISIPMKKTHMKKKRSTSFLLQKSSQILSFHETLKTLTNCSKGTQFLKKKTEARKLFVLKGITTLHESFSKISKSFFDQNAHDTPLQKKVSPKRSRLKGKKVFNHPETKFSSKKPESLIKRRDLAQLFLKKYQKISKTFEGLSRFLILPQSKFFTLSGIHSHSTFSQLESGDSDEFFKNSVLRTPILHEYSEIFHEKKRMIFRTFGVPKSLGSDFYEKRSFFSKEKNLKHIEGIIHQSLESETTLVPLKIASRTRSAHFLCQTIIQQFQKNFSFRHIYKNLLKDIQKDPSVQGVRLVCSGRFGGVEMARVESRKYGQTSLHVFSSHIDYAHGHAMTSSGLLGVKIWISYRLNETPSILHHSKNLKPFGFKKSFFMKDFD